MTVGISADNSHGRGTKIEISGTNLMFRAVDVETTTPTGGKIAKAAGFSGDQHAQVLQWRHDGDLEDIRLHEEADLDKGRRFIVAEASSTNRFTIDDEAYDWPDEDISGNVIRKLGRIPPEKSIYLERQDQPDRQISDEDVVPINGKGVEEFKSRKASWQISVQGVMVTSSVPEISAADALSQAGFDDPTAWIIILKVAGEPKRQITPSQIIDLRTAGIEKIRLTPKEVNNGEARQAPRREFSLLTVDKKHLDALGVTWETFVVEEQRWLLLHNYPLPPGYQVETASLALLVPLVYPRAEIDMFFLCPALQRSSGQPIPATEHHQMIAGRSYQRWSRHRGASSPWNPQRDNVVTHLALVESAIAKEVEQ